MSNINNFLNEFRLNKCNIIVFKAKKALIPCIFLLFTIGLVFFSNDNILAAKNGLIFWANNIVPSLFPFFVATELLTFTDIVPFLGRLLNPIMKPIFNLPGISSYALIMGLISGYPTGAKIVVNLRNNNLCSREEAERMLAFTNNSGPLFILGTVGISLFKSSAIGFILLFSHIIASLTVGIVFRFYKYTSKSQISNIKRDSCNSTSVFSNLGEILGNSIFSSVKTIIMIGGFVVLFSVIISILKNSNILHLLSFILSPLFKILGINSTSISYSFCYGIIELSNGIMQVFLVNNSDIFIKLLVISFLLGFGGISVMLQVYSIISKSDISIRPYIFGKLLHGIFACIYTYILIKYLHFSI